jgi:hypothetical protein
VKFDIGDFYKNLPIESKFGKSAKNNWHFTRRNKYSSIFPATLNHHTSALSSSEADLG